MKKLILSLLFLLLASQGAWATYPSYTVCPSGCDYNTLNGAVADLEANHATPASPVTITISGTWSSPDTTSVNITGITTSATNTVTITATGSARNNGTVQAGNYILGPASQTSCMTLSGDNTYLIIDGLIFRYTPGTFDIGGTDAFVSEAIPQWIFKNNIFYLNPGGNFAYGNKNVIEIGGATTGGTFKAYNNIFYNFANNSESSYECYGLNLTQYQGTYYVYNNTSYGNDYGFNSSNTPTNSLFKNNISYNNTTADYTGTFSTASTNNLSGDSTAPAYNTYYANATVTFVNAGSNNFNLSASDTGATGNGANLSSDSYLPFTTDITGATRTVPWDIGAFKATSTAVNHGFTRFLN